MKTKKVNTHSIKEHPNNPRVIKHDKFLKLVESVKNFPEMLEIRPIVVNKEGFIIGGNMRWNACLEAGIEEVTIVVADLTPDQEKEFMIKDNVSGGEWDFAALKTEWAVNPLGEWGVEGWDAVPVTFSPNNEPVTDNKEITAEVALEGMNVNWKTVTSKKNKPWLTILKHY